MCTGDHSASQKIAGNAVGGHLRCECCSVNFSKPGSLWNYWNVEKNKSKKLKDVLNVCKGGAEEAAKLGITRPPPLLGDTWEDMHTISPETLIWVNDFLLTFVCIFFIF